MYCAFLHTGELFQNISSLYSKIPSFVAQLQLHGITKRMEYFCMVNDLNE